MKGEERDAEVVPQVAFGAVLLAQHDAQSHGGPGVDQADFLEVYFSEIFEKVLLVGKADLVEAQAERAEIAAQRTADGLQCGAPGGSGEKQDLVHDVLLEFLSAGIVQCCNLALLELLNA